MSDLQEQSRSDWVDYAKCIGIVLVVYGHVARGVYNAGIAMPESFYHWTDSIIYTFHMPLFFFLSGLFFLNTFQKKGGLRLSISKIDTVFYPYIIWSLFQGVIEATLSSYTNGTVSYADVFHLLVEPRAQFWFLYALFFIFIVSAILFTLLPKKAVSVGLLVSLVLYLLIGHVYVGAMPNHVFHNLLFFILGIAFFHYFTLDAAVVSRWFLLWLLLFVVGQYGFYLHEESLGVFSRVAKVLLIVVSILLVVSIAYLGAKKPKKWIVFVGTASMAIYVMHILAGSGVRIMLSRFLDIDSYIVHLLLGTLMAIIAPLLVFAFIKKYRIPFVFSLPVSRWIDKR
ncbi:acyltransferase family protein [Eionea flava]